jgi:hypothetical protein
MDGQVKRFICEVRTFSHHSWRTEVRRNDAKSAAKQMERFYDAIKIDN